MFDAPMVNDVDDEIPVRHCSSPVACGEYGPTEIGMTRLPLIQFDGTAYQLVTRADPVAVAQMASTWPV